MKEIILASTSQYRRELLSRLGLPFLQVAPTYEEQLLSGSTPREEALRHALGKAREVLSRFPEGLVIGSDQVADLDGEPLGKPGTEAAAADQLLRMAGRSVQFHTALAVVGGGREATALETFSVRLRRLSRAQIESYVAREKPLDCAGSFRIEGLGIALMEALGGRDYTSLMGLPLIALTEMLGTFGIDVLTCDVPRTALQGSSS